MEKTIYVKLHIYESIYTGYISAYVWVCAKLLQLCDFCDPVNFSPPGSCSWNSPGKNTGVGCHALLHGIFPIQGSNPGLPNCHCQRISWILYHLSHQGSPLGTRASYLTFLGFCFPICEVELIMLSTSESFLMRIT